MRTKTAALVPLLLTGLLLTGCGEDEATSGLQVEDTGSGETVDLSPGYETGQKWRQHVSADMALDLMGQNIEYGFTLDMTTTVEEVGKDVTLAQAVNGVDVTNAPPGTEAQLKAELGKMQGATITSSYNEHGVQQGDSEWSGATQPEGQTSFSTMPAFPDEPVGEGASWTITTEMSPGQGIDDIEVETTYELVSIEGKKYTLELTQSGEISGEQDDVEVEGSFTGSGTMTGTVGDPMPGSMEFTQEIEASAEGQDINMTTQMSYTNK